MKKLSLAVLVALIAFVGVARPLPTEAAGHARGHYANLNGLRMYYEVHGRRHGEPPLVLLHGGFSSIDVSFGDLLPTLAKKRQVIAVELQGHGRTADIDRPLRFELLADDTVALLRQLGIRKADVFGYSMGGGSALSLAVRYPHLVRKLAIASVTYDASGWPPGFLDGIDQLRPEHLHGTVWHQEYLRLAPRPQDFPILVDKIKDLNHHTPEYTAAQIRAISAPTLILVGDTDLPRLDHAVTMFQLRGGGIPDGNGGPAKSELAILPGTTHVSMEDNARLLLPILPTFLARPS